MNNDYNKTLANFKKFSTGESETNFIALKLRDYFNKKKLLKTLDIGAGDLSEIYSLGRFLEPFGFRLLVDAIDIFEASPILISPPNIQVNRIRADFMELNLHKKYDLVYSRQSLYYLGDPQKAIAKMLTHTKKNGLIAIVTWDTGCKFRELSLSAFPDNNGSNLCRVKLESIGLALKLSPMSFTFNGTINIGDYKTSDKKMMSLAKFISRQKKNSASKIQSLSDKLKSLNDIETRSNAIVFFMHPNNGTKIN